MKPSFQPRCGSCGHKLKSKLKTSDKKKATRARRRADTAAKSEKHRMSTKEIRAACMERSGGWCEAWLLDHCWWVPCRGHAAVLDHWLGGSGRRKPRQSVETCWMLCATHNSMRTRNNPTAAFWNEVRKVHCACHGYPFVPHVVHAPVRRGA